MDALIEQLYRSAGDERRWTPALEQMARRFDARSGALMVYRGDRMVAATASPCVSDALQEYVASGDWFPLDRPRYALRGPRGRFVADVECFPMAVVEADRRALALMGLRDQMGLFVPLEDDHMAIFSVQRRIGQDTFDAQTLNRTRRLCQHLAGAALLSVTLSHQRARQAVSALQQTNHAAAVLDGTGRVVDANAAFSADLDDWARHDVRGRLRLYDRADDAVYRAAVLGMTRSGDKVVPDPVTVHRDGVPARALQLHPLLGETSDSMMGAQILLIVKPVRAADQPAGGVELLRTRFRLSPKEAQLVVLLADGHALRQAAPMLGLSYSSARTYLDRAYFKTNTHRQAELVALTLRAQQRRALESEAG